MKVHILSCSFDNYSYIIQCELTGKAAVVDPTEAYPVILDLEKNDLELESILCTHHHGDHVGDIETLLMEYPGLPVYCHSSDQKRIAGANRFVEDGDLVNIGEMTGKVLHTPGHTHGSLMYNFEDALFTGDTLFGGGCGRIFEGTPSEMLQSLTRTEAYPDDTKIYFGHEYTLNNLYFAQGLEPDNRHLQERIAIIQGMTQTETVSTPSTLGLERLTNPFLRSAQLSIFGCNTQLEVFTHIRQLKDRA